MAAASLLELGLGEIGAVHVRRHAPLAVDRAVARSRRPESRSPTRSTSFSGGARPEAGDALLPQTFCMASTWGLASLSAGLRMEQLASKIGDQHRQTADACRAHH